MTIGIAKLLAPARRTNHLRHRGPAPPHRGEKRFVAAEPEAVSPRGRGHIAIVEREGDMAVVMNDADPVPVPEVEHRLDHHGGRGYRVSADEHVIRAPKLQDDRLWSRLTEPEEDRMFEALYVDLEDADLGRPVD